MEPEPAAPRTIDLLDTRYISTMITAEIATPPSCSSTRDTEEPPSAACGTGCEGRPHAEGKFVALVAPCGFATGTIADPDDDAVNHLLKHDPEKWVPVFRKDHAQIKE